MDGPVTAHKESVSVDEAAAPLVGLVLELGPVVRTGWWEGLGRSRLVSVSAFFSFLCDRQSSSYLPGVRAISNSPGAADAITVPV